MEYTKMCEELKQIFPLYNTTKEYSGLQDTMYDVTMSCTPMECLEQLKGFIKAHRQMYNVIGMLAAYDIYCSVAKSIKDNM